MAPVDEMGLSLSALVLIPDPVTVDGIAEMKFKLIGWDFWSQKMRSAMPCQITKIMVEGDSPRKIRE